MQRSGIISRCHWLGGATDVNIKHKLTIWPWGNSIWKDPQEISSPASWSSRSSCEFRADSSGLGPVGLLKLQWWQLSTPILYCSRGMSWIHSANLPMSTVGVQKAPSETPSPGWTGSCLPASSHRASAPLWPVWWLSLGLVPWTCSREELTFFSVLAGELKEEKT